MKQPRLVISWTPGVFGFEFRVIGDSAFLTPDQAREFAGELIFAANCVQIAIDGRKDVRPDRLAELDAEVAATLDAAGVTDKGQVEASQPAASADKVLPFPAPRSSVETLINSICPDSSRPDLIHFGIDTLSLGDAARLASYLTETVNVQRIKTFAGPSHQE